jgi:uncharacterized protein (DUF58 family)
VTLRRSSRSSGGASLTSRGWGVLVGAVATVVAGIMFGIGELYALAAAGVAAVATALLWSHRLRWRVEVGRRLQPGRVEAGHGAVVHLTVCNRSSRRSPLLALRDPLDQGRRIAELVVAPLQPGERRAGSYRLPPIGRGVYDIGPVLLESVDPLGLARRLQVAPVLSTFTVHPRVEPLRTPAVAAGSGRDRVTARPAPGRDNDEFASLREYRVGDDIRRMHWASTARTDTLMVREEQLERRGQFGVVLDTRSELWSAASFERAVSVAASLVSVSLDGDFGTRLMTTAGNDSGSGTGRSHRSKLLDVLATIATHDPATIDRSAARPTPSTRARRPAGGTVALVTSERGEGDDLRRLAAVATSTDLVVVVVQRSVGASTRRAGGARTGRGTRVVRLGPGDALASVWDPTA